jgi:hypothetical protein
MIFRSTANIFKDFNEVFEDKWAQSNIVMTPPTKPWDYSRELQIEDVDIWEVIYEQGGGIGIYASWSPYAEFYLVRRGLGREVLGFGLETYYGAGAQKQVQKVIEEMGLPIASKEMWVEPEYMWLYNEH